MTRISFPIILSPLSKATSCCNSIMASLLFSFISSGICPSIEYAGVPSSLEYGKAPNLSNSISSTKSINSSCSSSVSDGNPVIRVVLIAMSLISFLSFPAISFIWALFVFLPISFNNLSLQCCIGISM